MKTRLKMRHVRSINEDGVIRNRGGATVSAEVDAETNEVLRYSIALCSPRDNFNRRYGKVKATNRMVSNETGVKWESILSIARSMVDHQIAHERELIIKKYERKMAIQLANLVK